MYIRVFVYGEGDHRDRHGRTPSSPSRRSSALTDALARRACGGLHALARCGSCGPLSAVYPPAPAAANHVRPAIAAAIRSHDRFLAHYLDSPPQTNEVARSGMILGGCLWIAAATGLPLDIHEIGSSAGLNLRFDPYRYTFGGRDWGDAPSPARIAAEWTGPTPSSKQRRGGTG